MQPSGASPPGVPQLSAGVIVAVVAMDAIGDLAVPAVMGGSETAAVYSGARSGHITPARSGYIT